MSADVTAQLAQAERRIVALEEQNRVLIEWIAGETAELYCLQIGMQMRSSGQLGIDGFKIPSPSTRAAWDTMKARMIEALTVKSAGTDG